MHSKGYQQFEAIGYSRGADGKLHTADDVDLGPIDVTWSAEEFQAVFGDDDKGFVGQLSPTALFTPASDGPNAERKLAGTTMETCAPPDFQWDLSAFGERRELPASQSTIPLS